MTLSEIKDQVAQESGYDDWYQIENLDLSPGEKAEIRESLYGTICLRLTAINEAGEKVIDLSISQQRVALIGNEIEYREALEAYNKLRGLK